MLMMYHTAELGRPRGPNYKHQCACVAAPAWHGLSVSACPIHRVSKLVPLLRPRVYWLEMEKYLKLVLGDTQFTALQQEKAASIVLITYHASHSVWHGQQSSQWAVFPACSAYAVGGTFPNPSLRENSFSLQAPELGAPWWAEGIPILFPPRFCFPLPSVFHAPELMRFFWKAQPGSPQNCFCAFQSPPPIMPLQLWSRERGHTTRTVCCGLLLFFFFFFS